jgi:hypothetical protein
MSGLVDEGRTKKLIYRMRYPPQVSRKKKNEKSGSTSEDDLHDPTPLRVDGVKFFLSF